MRGMLFVVLSFLATIVCWGVYGPVLHWGQHDMSTVDGQFARFLPFVCVGLAYFAIGVIVPVAWLFTRGEKGHWTSRGIILSLLAGSLGAVGALGIIMAFTFGGKPSYVMPLVFGGAPVVNSLLTIYMSGKMKEIGPLFLAGLIMVLLGAVTVLVAKPSPKHAHKPAVEEETTAAPAASIPAEHAQPIRAVQNTVLQVISIGVVVLCWGAYGPTLHQGQAAMDHSRMRPLLCVGVAYFLIAVVAGELILTIWPENSHWSFTGTIWSLAGGAAGALGALGIIMAFNFGGKPVYVMPLVFGGAPVVNTIFTITEQGLWGENLSLFFAGLILVIAGAVIVLVFAPRGGPAKKPQPEPKPKPAAESQPAS